MNSTTLPVLNAAALFPRTHPSAWMAAGLAAASLLLGPPVSVPAILLARQVRHEIARNLGRLTGDRVAAAAEITAWLSCFAWLSLALTAVVVVLPASATIVALGGIATGAFVLLRRWPRWLGASAATSGLLAMFLGTSIHHHLQRERAVEQLHECESARGSAAAAWAASDFQTAQRAYRRALSTCVGDDASFAASRLSELDVRNALQKLVQTATTARDSATRAAEDSARLERDGSRLRARFAAADVTTSEGLSQVRRLARSKQWEKARDELESVKAALAGFQRTEIEESARWKALSSEAQELRSAIQPALDKLDAQREAARQRQEAAETKRRERARHSSSSNRVRCCDGTLSPSCTYDRSLRGCCSWHGGVC